MSIEIRQLVSVLLTGMAVVASAAAQTSAG
jgi:hypothetical protein